MSRKLKEHNITLHGNQVTLRPMTENDWDVLLKWDCDPAVLYYSEGADVKSIDLMIGEKRLWGQGLGTDTIRTLSKYGFEKEGADMIFGLVGDYNLRSIGAFKRSGYEVDAEIEEASGEKARFSYDLVIRREQQ